LRREVALSGGTSSGILHSAPTDASFVFEDFSSREAGSPLGHNPLNVLRVNRQLSNSSQSLVQSDSQVFQPRSIEVIEVPVGPGGVNQRRNRVDQELGIQTFGSRSEEAMAGMIHPESCVRRPTPLLYVSLAERESARLSALVCPPFGDVRRLWRCRKLVVLNKLGVFGMFPMNCDLGHNCMRLGRGAGERGSGETFCLISALTPIS